MSRGVHEVNTESHRNRGGLSNTERSRPMAVRSRTSSVPMAADLTSFDHQTSGTRVFRRRREAGQSEQERAPEAQLQQPASCERSNMSRSNISRSITHSCVRGAGADWQSSSTHPSISPASSSYARPSSDTLSPAGSFQAQVPSCRRGGDAATCRRHRCA